MIYASEFNRHPLDGLKGIIPQPLKGEVEVHLVPSEEITKVLYDIHADRQLIGMSFILLLLLLFCVVVKYVFSSSRKG